jgi:hypothetical protein
MSAGFTANLGVLLLGAALVVVTFAFRAGTVEWISLGLGASAVLVALYNFALPFQGTYQRIADIVICVLGAWAIVAARVLTYHGRWLEFGAGAALAALGATGLAVREARLRRRREPHESQIDPRQLAALLAQPQREYGAAR